jgi:hypothetical protein
VDINIAEPYTVPNLAEAGFWVAEETAANDGMIMMSIPIVLPDNSFR